MKMSCNIKSAAQCRRQFFLHQQRLNLFAFQCRLDSGGNHFNFCHKRGWLLGLMRPGLLSPDIGYFRLFSLFSSWRASARLHLKKKKFLENFSVAGACSFHGADFCHNDKEAAVNTRRIYKAFAKVRAKIRPSKPMRVRISSAMDSIHPF